MSVYGVHQISKLKWIADLYLDEVRFIFNFEINFNTSWLYKFFHSYASLNKLFSPAIPFVFLSCAIF